MSKNVLIIDDDSYIGLVLKNKLIKEGFSATYAASGEIGLSIIEEGKFDIVVLDLIMPNMDGFRVLEKLKKNPKNKGIPVIVASNLSQPEDKDKALKMGATDYLIKFDTPLNVIVDKINSLL